MMTTVLPIVHLTIFAAVVNVEATCATFERPRRSGLVTLYRRACRCYGRVEGRGKHTFAFWQVSICVSLLATKSYSAALLRTTVWNMDHDWNSRPSLSSFPGRSSVSIAVNCLVMGFRTELYIEYLGIMCPRSRNNGSQSSLSWPFKCLTHGSVESTADKRPASTIWMTQGSPSVDST